MQISSKVKYKVQFRLMGMSIVLQVFCHKPDKTNYFFDLMIALDEALGITKVIRLHPEGEHECAYQMP